MQCISFLALALVPTLAAEQPQPISMTIFIHGTMSLKHYVSPNNILRFARDKVENCVYSHAISLMRTDPFFYQDQPMQAPGLQPIELHKKESGYASGAMAHLFELVQKKIGKHTPHNRYYTFGWSGLLSKSAREREGALLYEAIQNEVAAVRAQGYEPQIHIFAFSHGGNVALNMARAAEMDAPFAVHQLVLVGTPIQDVTSHLITHPLFERVYNVYSPRHDHVQTMDPFGSSHISFSKRIFEKNSRYELPAKLTQIEIAISRCVRGMHHVHCLTKYHRRLLRDMSPKHTELWAFGWSARLYRQRIPLYPLPVLPIIPVLINSVEPFRKKPEEPIRCQLIPELNHLVVRQGNQIVAHARLLDSSTWHEMRSIAYQFAPAQMSRKMYRAHAKKAHYMAYRMFNPPMKHRKVMRKAYSTSSKNPL